MRRKYSYMRVSYYKYQLFTNVDLFCAKYILPHFPGTTYVQFGNLKTEHTSLLTRGLIEVWYISTYQSLLKTMICFTRVIHRDAEMNK